MLRFPGRRQGDDAGKVYWEAKSLLRAEIVGRFRYDAQVVWRQENELPVREFVGKLQEICYSKAPIGSVHEYVKLVHSVEGRAQAFVPEGEEQAYGGERAFTARERA